MNRAREESSSNNQVDHGLEHGEGREVNETVGMTSSCGAVTR